MDLGYIDIEAISFPSIFSNYQAAMLSIQLADEDLFQLPWISDMVHLKTALGHFAKRWSIASKEAFYDNNGQS